MTSPALCEVPCPLCGSAERRLRFEEAPHAVHECVGCSLVYVSPRLTAGSLQDEVYGEEYWRSPEPRRVGYADYEGDAARHRATFQRRLGRIEGYLSTRGRVLDVGCAAGGFLEVMREAGWDVLGLEPSSAILAAAERRLGRERVIAGALEDLSGDAARELGRFDLVTMWDVLEHLPDPVAGLRTARSLLADGGRLVIETQNVASLFARVLGRRWQHYKHAEHLVHFRPATLERALDAAGLSLVARTSRGAGKVVSLGFVVERAARVSPALSRLLAPLVRLGNPSFYVNPHDEMIAVCEAA